MNKLLKNFLAVSVMSCGIAAFAAEPTPPPAAPGAPGAPAPAAQALKCPKCGCEMPCPKMGEMPGRAPGMNRQMPGAPGMNRQMPGGPGMNRQMPGPGGKNFQRGMRSLPFDMKDLSEAEMAKFLTLGNNVRTAMMTYRKEQNDVNRAALEKAVKEMTAFKQEQKVKLLEKKLAAAKADNAKIDELAKQETERMLKRLAERDARRQQGPHGQHGQRPEGPRPEGPRNGEGPAPR